jgi:hypothetical protein
MFDLRVPAGTLDLIEFGSGRQSSALAMAQTLPFGRPVVALRSTTANFPGASGAENLVKRFSIISTA